MDGPTTIAGGDTLKDYGEKNWYLNTAAHGKLWW